MRNLENLIIVSDIHAGCRLGLCPPWPIRLDDGGSYQASEMQEKVWMLWEEFWGVWVPQVTRRGKFGVVFNGDALDGVHHRATTQISHNLADQAEIAYQILGPIVELCEGNYWHIRGTEAHVGPSGVEEERLAKRLGALPNRQGQYARYELWKRVGTGLIHIMHHIGTTGSNAYESTAVHKEMVEAYVEAGRWGDEAPDVVVRSHRHRAFKTSLPSQKGEAISIVTPGWQLKTPFVYRIPGGRLAQPQFGGILVRAGDEDRIYTRSKTWRLERPEVE